MESKDIRKDEWKDGLGEEEHAVAVKMQRG